MQITTFLSTFVVSLPLLAPVASAAECTSGPNNVLSFSGTQALGPDGCTWKNGGNVGGGTFEQGGATEIYQSGTGPGVTIIRSSTTISDGSAPARPTQSSAGITDFQVVGGQTIINGQPVSATATSSSHNNAPAVTPFVGAGVIAAVAGGAAMVL